MNPAWWLLLAVLPIAAGIAVLAVLAPGENPHHGEDEEDPVPQMDALPGMAAWWTPAPPGQVCHCLNASGPHTHLTGGPR